MLDIFSQESFFKVPHSCCMPSIWCRDPRTYRNVKHACHICIAKVGLLGV